MNKKIVLNISALVLIITGFVLRILHLPLYDKVFLISAVIISVDLFLFSIKENKEAGLPNFINYFLSITLSIASISSAFSGMQKFGAFFIIAISLLLNIIMTLLLIFSKEPIKISKQYIINLFLYICLISSIVAFQELESFIEFLRMLISK